MDEANPTYLIENMGSTLRITVRHAFTDAERVEFTVIIPNDAQALPNLHSASFGRLRELLAKLP